MRPGRRTQSLSPARRRNLSSSTEYYCAAAAFKLFGFAGDGLLPRVRRRVRVCRRRGCQWGGGAPPRWSRSRRPGRDICEQASAGLELEDSTIFVGCCPRRSARGQRNLKFVGTLNFQFHQNEQESTAFSAFHWDRLHLIE